MQINFDLITFWPFGPLKMISMASTTFRIGTLDSITPNDPNSCTSSK
jgi:hypothetical protein